jgi:hypothetical protein
MEAGSKRAGRHQGIKQDLQTQMSIDNQDFDAKARLGYKDAKSRVYIGGRERLVGKDWIKRKKQLAERSGGRCERLFKANWGWTGLPNRRCGNQADDAHHIHLRSKERDDRLSNLLHVCRFPCHADLTKQQREAVRTVRRERVTYRMTETEA